MERAIPGVKEWAGDPDDLDLQYARKNYFGKSQEEAMTLFSNNPIESIDEIRWMPPEPFRYYLGAFAAYLSRGEALKDDMASDAASSFLHLVEEKLADAPQIIAPILEEMLPVAEYVAQNQDLFDADVDIYGNFLERYEQIKKLASSV